MPPGENPCRVDDASPWNCAWRLSRTVCSKCSPDGLFLSPRPINGRQVHRRATAVQPSVRHPCSSAGVVVRQLTVDVSRPVDAVSLPLLRFRVIQRWKVLVATAHVLFGRHVHAAGNLGERTRIQVGFSRVEVPPPPRRPTMSRAMTAYSTPLPPSSTSAWLRVGSSGRHPTGPPRRCPCLWIHWRRT